ncbi:MAG: prepilin-type N-terminal cleavage/methylation domain-containing protein [Myxococcales bacterium]|nr:prepilin-type N-terminal cleavage/methylation domain-containing protein [Myxococcales bacterium]
MNRRSGGFTLIEIMVSIGILSTITLMLWASSQGAFRTKKSVEGKMARYRVARLAMDRILRDVQMAYLSNNAIPGTEQTPRTYFDGVHRPDIDELRFTYFGHQRLYAESKEGDTAAVGYFGQRDKSDGGKLNLWRKETRRITAERIDNGNIPGEAEVIADDVVKLELRYYEPVRKEWLESWRTNQADGMPNRLPSRVSVKLVIRDDRGEELPLQSEVRIAMFQLLDTKPN